VRHTFRRVLALLALALPWATSVVAWSPDTQVAIAQDAASLAPVDLRRQIEKHPAALQQGALAPFRDSAAEEHYWHADGVGDLDHIAFREVQDTIDAIRTHEPFVHIVERLGRVSHWLADANNPLNAAGEDPDEARYYADYLRYAQSASPRFSRVFYAAEPNVASDREMRLLVYHALRRGRQLYPFVGSEYRRIDFAAGRGRFDDRSTAFGVAAVAYNRAVTDVARIFRYVWIASGGDGGPSPIWTRENGLILLSPGGAKAP
jgi:hypothetical protein